MTTRLPDILNAGIRALSMHGLRRSTIADIAAEAGVSRQTLYNFFSNREELLQAVVRHLFDQTVEQVEADLETAFGFSAQMEVFFRHAVLLCYDRTKMSPALYAYLEGGDPGVAVELQRYDAKMVELVTRLLTPHAAALTAHGMSVAQAADGIVAGSQGLMRTARSRDHLVGRLAALRAGLMAVVQG